MGGEQSAARATHFHPPPQEKSDPDEVTDEHHISISNKMVERLVEDAAVSGGAKNAESMPPRGDYKDKVYSDKLSCLDEKHSERLGLTMEELNATVRRIEIRTSNMLSVEPVCPSFKNQVIECYNSTDSINCWNTVGAFTNCVRDAAETRLRARTQKDAREHARRTRHVAHAREHALRDLGPPPGGDDSPPK